MKRDSMTETQKICRKNGCRTVMKISSLTARYASSTLPLQKQNTKKRRKYAAVNPRRLILFFKGRFRFQPEISSRLRLLLKQMPVRKQDSAFTAAQKRDLMNTTPETSKQFPTTGTNVLRFWKSKSRKRKLSRSSSVQNPGQKFSIPM